MRELHTLFLLLTGVQVKGSVLKTEQLSSTAQLIPSPLILAVNLKGTTRASYEYLPEPAGRWLI